MRIGKYKWFIPQNVAPYEAIKIGIYKDNTKKGSFNLQNLRLPRLGTKIYSFGCTADAHTFLNASYVEDTTANDDFVRALNWYKVNADFLCICGDITSNGLGDLPHYKQLVDEHSGDMEVYAMAGNHEWWGGAITSETMMAYTGYPLWYSFERGNDVFIMCGVASSDYQFTNESLQWLYETLEANRNKRCFLFVHPPFLGYSGDPTRIYPFDMLSGTMGEVFRNLLRHYKNVIYLHAHTHILYESQIYAQNNGFPNCIYDNVLGIHSIHIPSLAIPIDITSGKRVVVSEKSQGYLIDVYRNHVVLRGRDFVKEKFLPIATYCLDTTLVNVEANTFVDSTGTITT